MPEDMVREVMSHLTLRELLALSQIEGWEDIAHGELATKNMMQVTKSLMSGSIALYICNPGSWTPGDIDFYCPVGELDHVLSFLTIHGYELIPEDAKLRSQVGAGVGDHENGRNQDDEGAPASTYSKHVIKTIATLQKNGENGPKLNVIESSLPCAEAPIFCFHSTVVMNAITSLGVVCYYPEWTAEQVLSTGLVVSLPGRP